MSDTGIWDGTVPYVYVYRTSRDDGMNYAVGRIKTRDSRVEGSVALFGILTDAITYVTAYADATGALVSVMPSVFAVRVS